MSSGAQSTCTSPQGSLTGRPLRLKTTIALRAKPLLRKATALKCARDTAPDKKRPSRRPRRHRTPTGSRDSERTGTRRKNGELAFIVGDKHHSHHQSKTLTRRQSQFRQSQSCHNCGRTATPQWRQGPDGLDTLCNLCGLIWGKRWTTDHDIVLSPRVAMAKRQGFRWNPSNPSNPSNAGTPTGLKSDDAFFSLQA